MEVKRQKPEIKSRNLEKSACRSPHQSAGNCRYPCGQEGAHIQARASLGNTTGNFQNVLQCPPTSPFPGYMDLYDTFSLDVEGSKRSVFKKQNVTKVIGASLRQYYKKSKKQEAKNHVFVFVSLSLSGSIHVLALKTKQASSVLVNCTVERPHGKGTKCSLQPKIHGKLNSVNVPMKKV